MDTLSALLTPYLLSIIVSTGIGLIIGLEREFRKANEKDHFAGIRTFPLVALSGCTIAYVSKSISHWVAAAGLATFILFVATAYVIRSLKGRFGLTTEISLILTFVLGMMASFQLFKEALAATVITTTLLTLKGKFHSFVVKITEEELFAFVKFIILCLLLFPFLPDADYGPNGILNPREIGVVVVIVSSLSFVAYLLIKFSGTNKGILVTGFFGGLFSSTAVTWMFASRSRKSDLSHSTTYATGIILACSVMFIRVAITASIFNGELFLQLILPCLLMSLTGFGFVVVFRRQEKAAADTAPVEIGNPVNILNALGFGVLYVCISLLVYYGGDYFGNRGLILSGLISGFADVDAITINISKLAVISQDLSLSVKVIIMATISNTCVKLGITLLKGTVNMKKQVSLALGSTIVVGVWYILLFLKF